MPATDSPAVIVARFLKANHYSETLEAFLSEAGLPQNAGDCSPGDWTIEQILEEKKQYDASLIYEKRTDDGDHGWSKPAPSIATEPDYSCLSNVLCVAGDIHRDAILLATADRAWVSLSGFPPYKSQQRFVNAHGSPILAIKTVGQDYLLSTSMSGQMMLHQASTGQLIDKCRHHLKYIVQVAAHVSENNNSWIIATAGWDAKVLIYAPQHTRLNSIDIDSDDEEDDPCLPDFFGEPMHAINLTTNPESIVFVKHPDTGVLHLVLSRRDSTFLYYYSITRNTSAAAASSSSSGYTITPTGRQNLAPHANAWVGFTPSCLAVSPRDPTLLAIATSHLPHMKVIIVRLLFPTEDSPTLPSSSNNSANNGTAPLTQASQARAALAVQDREDTAIRLHVSTMAPQTPYSTPQVVWRPDGSGVFVNGDDGVIRGVEVQTGKVVSFLKAHESGSKVRTLWCGYIGGQSDTSGHDEEKGERREILVSGGFDKKVFIWEPESKD